MDGVEEKIMADREVELMTTRDFRTAISTIICFVLLNLDYCSFDCT